MNSVWRCTPRCDPFHYSTTGAHCSKSVFKFYGNSLLAYIYRADYFI